MSDDDHVYEMSAETFDAFVADINSAEPTIVVPEQHARSVLEAVDNTMHMLDLMELHDQLFGGSMVETITPDYLTALAERGTGMVRDWLRDHDVSKLSFWYPSRRARDWVFVAWAPSPRKADDETDS